MYEPGTNPSFWTQPYVVLGLYVYFAFCWYAIARKLQHSNPWWAFIPFLNMYQWVEMARKPWYWFIFMFIPAIFMYIPVHMYQWFGVADKPWFWFTFMYISVFTLGTYAVVWYDIAKARTKSSLWGICMLIPVLNLLAVLIMTLGEPHPAPAHPYEEKQPVREPANVESQLPTHP